MISAEEAKRRLIEGNQRYLGAVCSDADVSPEIHPIHDPNGLRVEGAVYHIEDGRVEFI